MSKNKRINLELTISEPRSSIGFFDLELITLNPIKRINSKLRKVMFTLYTNDHISPFFQRINRRD